MSCHSILIRLSAGRTDRKRDRSIPLPEGITECRNIAYSRHGKWGLLDVCFPENANGPLPTIVSLHGGGYVYGDKELYRRYCMDLARRGFSVVNFSYRLAPKWKFPTPLVDANAVMEWLCQNAAQYHLDPDRLFIVGDSAGAQPMEAFLAAKGIKTCLKCYGREEDQTIGHVFHINILLAEAVECNDAQCAFFNDCL